MQKNVFKSKNKLKLNQRKYANMSLATLLWACQQLEFLQSEFKYFYCYFKVYKTCRVALNMKYDETETKLKRLFDSCFCNIKNLKGR